MQQQRQRRINLFNIRILRLDYIIPFTAVPLASLHLPLPTLIHSWFRVSRINDPGLVAAPRVSQQPYPTPHARFPIRVWP